MSTEDPPPTATRADVARLAGVSDAVVSYVVNGSKRVSPETEARVRAAVSKLGYRPNPAARALRLGSMEALGMIVPDLLNPFFAELTHAAEQAATRRGYTLMSMSSDGVAQNERKRLELLVERRVDGILLCSNFAIPDLPYVDEARIPTVLLNQQLEDPMHVGIGTDLYSGGVTAVTHLVDHGYEDIGLVYGVTTGAEEDGREVGWASTLDEHGLTPAAKVRRPFSPAGGYSAMRTLIEEQRVPRALFVSSDQQSRGVLRAAHEAGIRIPSDLAIVSFDGSIDARFSWPSLTTVAQPIESMADSAVEALLGDGHLETSQLKLFPGDLVIGQSCGCAIHDEGEHSRLV